MIKDWNTYNDINNDITLKYDQILLNEIGICNNVNIVITQIKKSLNINEIDLEIPISMNTKNIISCLNNFVIIIEHVSNNLSLLEDNIIYLNYMKDVFNILNEIFKYNTVINSNNILRSSYNFCNKYPICFDYYSNLIKTKYKNKCNCDHITLNKLYKDYMSLYNFVISNKDKDLVNVQKSLNTILYVFKENIKIINNIVDIIKNKKIELHENVSLYNFLLKN